jgi:FK506-binding protein 5
MEIPMYFVLAYLQVTNGIFYELASGHIRPVVNPTYANMYGTLNQNGFNDNQGFNQNTYDSNQGYGQNMPNNNPGYGQNMPNNNPGYGQNMPNSNQGYNQNMPNDNQGYDIQDQTDFNHGVDKNQASFGESEIQEAQNVHQDAVNSSETQVDSDENFDTER